MRARFWVVTIADFKLESPNKIIRAHPHVYKDYRNDIYWLVRKGISPGPPAEPLRRCKIMALLLRKRLLDIDSKAGALKPILDVLQPARKHGMRGGLTAGIGVIAADTDGEAGAGGVITELRVEQRQSKREAIILTITGLDEHRALN